MVFLWFSYGFPMVFLWFSYGFPLKIPLKPDWVIHPKSHGFRAASAAPPPLPRPSRAVPPAAAPRERHAKGNALGREKQEHIGYKYGILSGNLT